MNSCHAERISVLPTSCDSAHSENQRTPLLFIPQHGVNGFIFSIPHDRLTFPVDKREVPRLETGISERYIAHDRSNAAPEKGPNSFDHTPGAFVDSYSAYDYQIGACRSSPGRTPIRCTYIKGGERKQYPKHILASRPNNQ